MSPDRPGEAATGFDTVPDRGQIMPERTLSRSFFVILLVGTTVLFLRMMAGFLVPVLLAIVFCTLFAGLNTRLVRVFRGRRGLAAITSCLLLLLGLAVPIYAVGDLVARQAVEFYGQAQAGTRALLAEGGGGALGRLQRLPWVHELRLDQIDWRAGLQDLVKTTGSFAATVIQETSRGTFEVVAVLFVTLFTMFYFFRDGQELLARLRSLVPMAPSYQDDIIARFSSVTRATMRGTLLIGILQGVLATITLWIFGVGSAVLWGVVTAVLSVLPVVGAWIVLYPAGLIQMATGHFWQGAGILIVTTVVVVNVDNFVRPRLVGQEAGMHDLMVFFSTLGGIGMFGAMGFLVGPVIAALFLSVLQIYRLEFHAELDQLSREVAESGPA